MASIYKDSKGYWNAQIEIGLDSKGKRKYKRFRAKTKKEVQTRLDKYKLDTHNLELIPNDGKISVSEYINYYLDTYKKNKIKRSSNTRNYGILNNQLKYIADIPLKDLTTSIIQVKLINQLFQDGYSFSTIHKAYTLLNESLNKAISECIISFNPCAAVELPSKETLPQKQIEILSESEIKDFLSAVKTQTYNNSYAIALVLFTGLRCGELCALKWSDIDFTKRIITVQRNISIYQKENKRAVEIQEGTKTRLKRIIPLNDNAIEILNYIKVYNPNSEFLIKTNSKVPDVSIISSTYNRIIKYAGIKGKTGIHTLRHTFASELIKHNIDIKIVSEILGHSSVSFTYDTYVHLNTSQKLTAVQDLNFLNN